jgi:hypothetical protein
MHVVLAKCTTELLETWQYGCALRVGFQARIGTYTPIATSPAKAFDWHMII